MSNELSDTAVLYFLGSCNNITILLVLVAGCRLQVAADFFILIFCTTVKLYRLFTVLSDEGSERLTDRQLDRLLIFPPYLLFMMMSEQAEDDDDDDVLLLLKKQNNKQQLTMPDASRCIAAHGH